MAISYTQFVVRGQGATQQLKLVMIVRISYERKNRAMFARKNTNTS